MEDEQDLGQYMIYLVVAVLIMVFPMLTVRAYTSMSSYESIREHERVQDYIFSRSVIDCLSYQSDLGPASLGTLARERFTDDHLRACTSEPVVVTLQESGQAGITAIATNPILKQYTSLSTLRQEYVLLDGKRALVTVGERDA